MMKKKMVWLLAGLSVVTSNVVLAGNPTTAGGRQALQMFSSETAGHIAALQQKSQATADNVLADINQAQTRDQKKLTLQMRINQLRSELGGVTDSGRRQALDQQIRTLQKERAEL